MRTAVRYKTIKTTFNRLLKFAKTRLLLMKAIKAAKFIHILKKRSKYFITNHANP